METPIRWEECLHPTPINYQSVLHSMLSHFSWRSVSINPKRNVFFKSQPVLPKCLYCWSRGYTFICVLQVEKELEYLSKISDLAVLLLTPISYSVCQITRQLLKEILSKQVLFNMIEMITDPDYINQKLLILVHKIQEDQKVRSEQRFSVDGKVIGLTERVLKESDNEDIISSHTKPPFGRFDSADSETGTSSETFQVGYTSNSIGKSYFRIEFIIIMNIILFMFPLSSLVLIICIIFSELSHTNQ